METKIYKIKRIEGEYAYLEDESGEELFIAMALLPLGADVGMMLINHEKRQKTRCIATKLFFA